MSGVDAKMMGDLGGAAYTILSGGLGKYLDAKYRPGQSTFDLMPLPVPKAPDGQSYGNIPSHGTIVAGGVSIGMNNKNIIETTKWVDYHYSPEGIILTNYGLEGKTHTVVNGERIFTDLVLKNPEGLTVLEAAARYAGGTITQFPHINEMGTVRQIRGFHVQQRDALRIWPTNTSMMLPSLFLPDDQTRETAAILSEVRTYLDEMVNRFIMGVEPINDTTWNTFITTLKNMGIEKVVNYYSVAYQKYIQS
jgi:putative aldouronate transport system substrate-binding protein